MRSRARPALAIFEVGHSPAPSLGQRNPAGYVELVTARHVGRATSD